MTTTPKPAVCGARHRDAVGAVLECERPAGHAGAHEAHTTPDQRVFWPNPRTTAEAPATAEQVVTAADPCPGCETCDLATQLSSERAVHDAHRTAVSEALGGNVVDWPEVIRRVRKAIEDRDGQRAEVRRLRAAHEDHRQQLAVALERGPGADWYAIRAAAAEYVRRAELAEAAITRVRDLADRWEHALAADLRYARSLRAALGDDQPADATLVCTACEHPAHRDPCPRTGCPCGVDPEPAPREVCCECGSPDVAYHNYRDQPFCDPCANGRQNDPQPETVPVLDALVTEMFAEFNRILRTLRSPS